jgi:hypothetical protein
VGGDGLGYHAVDERRWAIDDVTILRGGLPA